jgi:hypothetical protein
MSDPKNVVAPSPDELVRTHLRFGWWAICLFVSLGLVLEALNGFKVSWYLDVGAEARRTTLTLAHAHGTLFGLINVVFALSLSRLGLDEQRARRVSASLRGATILLPGGFVLGGIVIYGGDPGLGVVLVPIGAVLMIMATFAIARASRGPK